MRKTILVFAMIALVAVGTGWAGDEAATPAALETGQRASTFTKAEGEGDSTSCNTSALSNEEWLQEVQSIGGAGNPASCPTIQKCTGTNYFECNQTAQCGAEIQRVDTGWTGCGGSFCLSGTIVVERGRCEVCDCCFTVPGCLCEQDPSCTGYAVRDWYCQD